MKNRTLLYAGIALAAVLIALRRGAGALPSSGARPGANTILAIDAPPASDAPTPADDRSLELRSRSTLVLPVRG